MVMPVAIAAKVHQPAAIGKRIQPLSEILTLEGRIASDAVVASFDNGGKDGHCCSGRCGDQFRGVG